MLENYAEELARSPKDSPRFDYVAWYATHYFYYYPPEFERFKPVVTNVLDFSSPIFRDLQKNADLIKNRYRNSVLYFDSRADLLLSELESQGRLQNTIVVITGDHGEEFWEHGRFSHTYGISNEQTMVALFMLFPNQAKSQYDFSSHDDIMPTIFDSMGIALPDEKIMTGNSLLQYDPKLDYALTSMGIMMFQVHYEHVVIGSPYKVSFINNGPIEPGTVYDLEDNRLLEFDATRVDELLHMARDSKTLLKPR